MILPWSYQRLALQCGVFHIHSVNFQESDDPTMVIPKTNSVRLSIFAGNVMVLRTMVELTTNMSVRAQPN